MWTPQSDGKRERLCFIERKDKSFVSNCRDFRREMFLFFDLANGKTKTRGLFFDLPLVSLIALLLFVSFSPSFAHSSPTSAGAPSRMTHARGDAHPRLAHSASFPFFAFTPHLQSAEQLLVRGELLHFLYLHRRVKELHRKLHPQSTVAQSFVPIG